jgi:putative hydrolase of the HAD superfamily
MNGPEVLFLDVDDTLYPHSSGLWAAVRGRIQAYIENKIGILPGESEAIRQRFLQQYGTTLRGLQQEFEVEAGDYLKYVHDVPVEQLLEPDPVLRCMLQSLPMQIYYFTNAYRPYIERVLRRLDILDLEFEIIDIMAMEYENKPLPGAYRRALAIAGNPSPSACLLADDRLANLQPAATLGMHTVLVGNRERAGGQHFTIPDIAELPGVLAGLNRA